MQSSFSRFINCIFSVVNVSNRTQRKKQISSHSVKSDECCRRKEIHKQNAVVMSHGFYIPSQFEI